MMATDAASATSRVVRRPAACPVLLRSVPGSPPAATVKASYAWLFPDAARALRMRCDKSSLAFSSAARRDALSPLPARLMKYVNIRIPEPGPLGETFFEASSRAMVSGDRVKSPFAGWVESVFTFPTHRGFFVPEFPVLVREV